MTDAQSISIHALLAESDGCVRYCIHGRGISIHALLAESDRKAHRQNRFQPLFLSTLSLRRATLTDDVSTGGKIISIHALLAESDGGFGVGS